MKGGLCMIEAKQPVQHEKRQHPLWILFDIGKSIKEVIIPVIYFFLFKMGSESSFIKYGSFALLAYIVYRVISILFSWKNYKYVITAKNIEITEGKLKKDKRYIAFNRIQSVQQHTTFFHRMFKLTSLTMLTGATDDNSNIKLDVISYKEAKRIQHQLSLSSETQRMEHTNERSTVENEETVLQPTKHYEMARGDIVKAAFTSFYFLAPIPFLFAIYVKLDNIYSLDDKAKEFISSINLSWIMITMIGLTALLLSSIIGITITYLQYGNFQISSDQELVFIQKGIFNQTNFSIPKNKINAIKLNKSPLRQWVNMVQVELVSAGSADEEESQTNVLFPFISERCAKRLIPDILPAFHFQEEITKLPASALWANLLKPSYLWMIATGAVFYFWPAYWYASPILLILIVISRIIEVHRSGYTLSDPFIQLERGVISTESFITRHGKIVELEVTESWVQRRFGLASLTISTRAKPIETTVISHIPKETAFHYYQWYAS